MPLAAPTLFFTQTVSDPVGHGFNPGSLALYFTDSAGTEASSSDPFVNLEGVFYTYCCTADSTTKLGITMIEISLNLSNQLTEMYAFPDLEKAYSMPWNSFSPKTDANNFKELYSKFGSD